MYSFIILIVYMKCYIAAISQVTDRSYIKNSSDLNNFRMFGFRGLVFYGALLSSCFFVLVLYILGTAHYLISHEENTCEMTYMFEYPQYVVCNY